jgi:hypothetical protein
MTIAATVMDVSLSARIIVLEGPVEGFSIIALTDESDLMSADGSEMALRDIQPGATIQASGHPGESNALIAGQVLVLDAAPTLDPMEMILPPDSAPSPLLLSLNPQNLVHVFVIPLAIALILLLTRRRGPIRLVETVDLSIPKSKPDSNPRWMTFHPLGWYTVRRAVQEQNKEKDDEQ